MSHTDPNASPEAKLRRVRYTRWSGFPRCSWEPVEDTLLAFVYDHYVDLDACGVFPPFHLLNQVLLRGGGAGGMGPGAKWEPFSLSREEYDLLVDAIRTVPPGAIEGLPRPVPLPFTFDPEFDGPPETYPVRAEEKPWHRHIQPDHRAYVEWRGAVGVKHGERYCAEMKRAGLMS
jgi:hypothetical protein